MGFTVTFDNTEAVNYQIPPAHHSPINPDIFSDVRASGLDIRYLPIGCDGLAVSSSRSQKEVQLCMPIFYPFSTHVEALMRKLLLTSPPVTCLIADSFFVWPFTRAKKLGLAYVSFWTQPATVFTLFYHMDLLVRNGHYACRENRKDTITYIPGLPAIEPADLMSYLQVDDIPPTQLQIIYKGMEGTMGADFVLCNGGRARAGDHLRVAEGEAILCCIGPIFPADFTRSTVTSSLWSESDGSEWLDSQPAGCVLYISIGSYANVSKRDLEEIAYGILDSKAFFIWAIRRDIVRSDEPEPLPKEFFEERHERGIVVPWRCQREVLSHSSTCRN